MSLQTIKDRPFFKPRPECDNLMVAHLLWHIAENILVSPSGCWEWQGAKSPKGYGQISSVGSNVGGKKTGIVHRLVYHLCVQEVPSGLCVCHDCPAGDNPACCNPDHLWLGDRGDNIRDCVAKGRFRSPACSGEQNGRAELTAEQVEDIRVRGGTRKRGIIRQLAKEYQKSVSTISRIINGRGWRKQGETC